MFKALFETLDGFLQISIVYQRRNMATNKNTMKPETMLMSGNVGRRWIDHHARKAMLSSGETSLRTWPLFNDGF